MKKFLKFTLLFLAFVTFACKPRPAPIIDNSNYVYKSVDFEKYINSVSFPDEDRQRAREKFVIIKAGDNLYKIAKENNSTTKEIINRNKLSAPFLLPVGKKIYIPTPDFYIVKNGDSLYSIAKNYHSTIAQIASKNNLSQPYQITPGQKLIIGKNIYKSKKINSDKIYSKGTEKLHLRNIKNAGFAWPLKGKVISSFGPKKGGMYNDGINIAAKKGSAVKSSQNGTVAYVGDELKGYGNLIIIKHPNRMITAYGHLGKTLVKRGDQVNKEQTIAYVSNSGNVSDSQLYFGLRKGKNPVNPQKYLKN